MVVSNPSGGAAAVYPWVIDVNPVLTPSANTNWSTLNLPSVYGNDSAGNALLYAAIDSAGTQNDDYSLVTLRMASKNASASSYQGTLQWIRFRRTA